MSNLIAKWNSINTLPEEKKRVIIAWQSAGDFPSLYFGYFEKDEDGVWAVFENGRSIPERRWKVLGIRYWMEVPELPKE